jgi:hypothetical protein
MLASAGDLDGAQETLGEIRDPLHQARGFEKVVEARAVAGDVAGALRLALDSSLPLVLRQPALTGLGRGVSERLDLDAKAARGVSRK